MATELTIAYDRASDVLRIGFGPRTSDVEGDFIADDIYARFDTTTGTLQTVELLGFSSGFQSRECEVHVPLRSSEPDPDSATATDD